MSGVDTQLAQPGSELVGALALLLGALALLVGSDSLLLGEFYCNG